MTRQTQRTWTALGLGLLMLLSAGPGWAATFTWVGPASGNQSWDVAANWFDGSVNQVPVYPDDAIVGDTSAVRNISTSASTPVLGSFSFNQSSGGAAFNQVTLGGNLTTYDYFGVNFSNSAAAANQVLDLNGNTFFAAPYPTISNATIRGTGGGTLDTYGLSLGTSVVEANVKVIDTGAYYGGGVWNPGSIFVLRGSTTAYGGVSGVIDRLELGESASATQGSFRMNAIAWSVRDMVIYEPTSSPSSPLLFFNNTLSVAGNFTDHGADSSPSYAPDPGYVSGTVVFNGNPVTARTVSIDRHLNSTIAIRVGNSIADTGNIALAQDLDAAGAFLVRNGSSVDVADFDLNVGSFTGEPGINLTFSVGNVDSGLINVAGALSLGTVNLNLVRGDFSDNSGYDITLFTYGSLVGSPTFNITTPANWSYSSLSIGGGSIVLNDVYVPEPATAGLLALGVVSVLRREQKRGHHSSCAPMR